MEPLVTQHPTDPVCEALRNAKEAGIALAKSLPQVPQLGRGLSQFFLKLDEAYMWLVVDVAAAIQSLSPEALEAQVQRASAAGNLRVVDSAGNPVGPAVTVGSPDNPEA